VITKDGRAWSKGLRRGGKYIDTEHRALRKLLGSRTKSFQFAEPTEKLFLRIWPIGFGIEMHLNRFVEKD
jgi:hypothetical protein